jgi:hypothetical protein
MDDNFLKHFTGIIAALLASTVAMLFGITVIPLTKLSMNYHIQKAL